MQIVSDCVTGLSIDAFVVFCFLLCFVCFQIVVWRTRELRQSLEPPQKSLAVLERGGLRQPPAQK